jgi:hypothetical protein
VDEEATPMTSRSIGIRFAIAVASLLTASSARAECISPGAWWLRDKLVEVVFSGTAIEVTRTAEAGYRATFDVERVWKGHVPRRFNLYVWELSPEMDRIDAGRRYLVGAKRLIDARARQGLGLVGTDSVAFTEVNCGAPDYKEAERTGIIRDLGAGQPPDQPPADFAFKFDFKPCMTDSYPVYDVPPGGAQFRRCAYRLVERSILSPFGRSEPSLEGIRPDQHLRQ